MTWKWDVLGVSTRTWVPATIARSSEHGPPEPGGRQPRCPSMFAGGALKRSVTTASVPGAEEPSFPHGRARHPSAMVKRAKEDSRRFYYIHTRNFLFIAPLQHYMCPSTVHSYPLSIPIHSPFELSKRGLLNSTKSNKTLFSFAVIRRCYMRGNASVLRYFAPKRRPQRTAGHAHSVPLYP